MLKTLSIRASFLQVKRGHAIGGAVGYLDQEDVHAVHIMDRRSRKGIGLRWLIT